MNGLIGCNSTNNSDFQILNSKNLIRIVDILGKKTNQNSNEFLFYMYDDGTVEKRIILE